VLGGGLGSREHFVMSWKVRRRRVRGRALLSECARAGDVVVVVGVVAWWADVQDKWVLSVGNGLSRTI
jgi:hypothetical protein